MRKATHTGTCQVCGREQALPFGKLAKHGYDVMHHYFHGVCPGADHLPLEQDRAFADEVAAGLMITSRSKAAAALAVEAGELLPKRAKSGRRVPVNAALPRGRMEDELVPFDLAPAHHQQQAVAALLYALQSESKECARISEMIVARADRTTGKRDLTPRKAEAPRKVIGPGTRVKLHGVERVVVRVEERMARGCGPFLNGNYMPHVIYLNPEGVERAYPLRLIRQAAILEVTPSAGAK